MNDSLYFSRAKELCPCQTNYLKQHVVSYASQYSHALRDLIDTKIYDGYTEFAVVLQPFFRDFAMPRTSVCYSYCIYIYM